ncbi:MAG: nucleotide sugar dehydrogenase [Candidatus Omnitrophica bacterium]|nr:nucleotide sugar dehydrogenase [Candidatus Omnitrophota bacterium]MCM8825127.1 nucleotide sugar dehydrogenase [Candidatus Omnitrophota bacterium]
MENLAKKIQNRTAIVGVIGLGYVGLPLALRFAKKRFKVIGFDVDKEKVSLLNNGKSYISHIKENEIKEALNFFQATSEMKLLSQPDAIVICVPTPLDAHNQPDLTYIKNTASEISRRLRKGQLISLESTTYPGTTREILVPELGKSGLMSGKDFFVVFSPEREDPGNKNFTAERVPKIVGGLTNNCLNLGSLLYGTIFEKVVPVSSVEIAESAKLLENIYRSVNIALVNELKVLFDRMGINIWEVIEAAKTKPFGFQAFYPGPGLGGHCIPIDPFYLTWKAREYDFHTRFIELAGEINSSMPYYVVEKLIDALNARGKALQRSKVLIIGVAYKKDIDDARESPGIRIMKILEEKNVRKVDYYDPYIPELVRCRQICHPIFSIKFSRSTISKYDAVIIVTDHSCIDYKLLLSTSHLIIDTRNVYKRKYKNVVKA